MRRPHPLIPPALILIAAMAAPARADDGATARPSAQPASAPGLPTLFLIGDSTVNNRTKGQLGWGDPLAASFDPTKIRVENRARGGRSSRTYRTEGLWDQVLAATKPGDFVLVQFGHNDGGPVTGPRARASLKGTGDETREIVDDTTGRRESVHTYGWYLRKYIADTKAKGASPIVLSPIPRNIWNDDRTVARASHDYGRWAADAAQAEGASFIDLNEMVARRYEDAGPAQVKELYFGADHTHTSEAGARLNAAVVIEGLEGLEGCSLCGNLSPGVLPEGSSAQPDEKTTEAQEAAAQPAPSQPTPPDGPTAEWVEPSGHRVIRLSPASGGASFYFHQNAYTAAGDKLVISTGGGLATIDLRTRAIEPVVEGRAGQAVVGRKTRQVFYVRGDTVYATHLDTRATRVIVKLPPEIRRGSGLAVNADETLLAGSYTEDGPRPTPPTPLPGRSGSRGQGPRRPGSRGGGLEARWAARLPMRLYTIRIDSGEVKTFHPSNDWLNHVQFSPTDPTLLLFCHEGPWHKVDRIWTIRTDGTGLQKIHSRTMDMEIAGHEFFSPDGAIVWYDLQTPKGKEFWLAGHVLATGETIKYRVERGDWSVHFNVSPDGSHFAGDGGGPRSVAAPGNGQWIDLFTPQDGALKAQRLVDLSRHDYTIEPNVTFTPDGKWIVFRSNMQGPSHVYAVEVRKTK